MRPVHVPPGGTVSARTLATLWHGPRLTVRIEWKGADLWVGAFWRRDWVPPLAGHTVLEIWICLVPCVPLHVAWRSHAEVP